MSIKVEVFSTPGCSKCTHAKEALRQLAEELGVDVIEWREVNILQELDYAVALGVLSTPAIAINKKLVFSRLPSLKALRAELTLQLNKGH